MTDSTAADAGPHGAPSGSDIETGLSRDLGLISCLAIGTGTMIAAGIFTLSGLAVGYVGSAAIASFLIAAVVATFTALTYSEFSSIYPHSGEGYLYARKTFTPPSAYVVGWCLLLGYASSCAFYIASLSAYFNEFIWHSPIEPLSGLVILAALVLLNVKGTKESGTFQIIVTAAKIALLVWFVAGGLRGFEAQVVIDRFSTDFTLIVSTASLVFITFFGFSAIAASAGEVVNPTRTIPRAIFISMGIVTVLYSLVVLVVVVANLTEYSESAMGTAARLFLGPVGGMVIVGGALFSMISASNASIMAGSRVALSMARLGHLPRGVGSVNPSTRTPVVSVLLVGGGIGFFAILLPLEPLAEFANLVLLTALTFVNVALIRHRRAFPAIERPFKVPLVPLLPILGMVANVYLILQIPLKGHWQPMILAALAVLGGFAAFVAWKGAQDEVPAAVGPPSRVILERPAHQEARFRILLPVARPASVERLVSIGAAIASSRHGEIVALRVVIVPEQLPATIEDRYIERNQGILNAVRQQALDREVPVSAQIRVGHHLSPAILETSKEKECDLILLGWKGSTTTRGRILGEVTDEVVHKARTDILLVKRIGLATSLRRLLLPTAGGPHARRAQGYAADIVRANGGTVTLCAVVPPDATQERIRAEEERLAAERAAQMKPSDSVEYVVLRHESVSDAIIEAGGDYDAIMMGAAGSSFSRRILFGTIPERIARDSDQTVLVVKHYQRVRAMVGRVMED